MPYILDAVDCLLPLPAKTIERGERDDAVGRGLGGTKGKLASTESVLDANDSTDPRRLGGYMTVVSSARGCSSTCCEAREGARLVVPRDLRVAERASDATFTRLATPGWKDLMDAVGVPIPNDILVIAVL